MPDTARHMDRSDINSLSGGCSKKYKILYVMSTNMSNYDMTTATKGYDF